MAINVTLQGSIIICDFLYNKNLINYIINTEGETHLCL